MFWPVMLVLAGTFAYLGVTFLKSALRGNGRAFEASGEVMSMSRSGVMFLLVKSDRKRGMIP